MALLALIRFDSVRLGLKGTIFFGWARFRRAVILLLQKLQPGLDRTWPSPEKSVRLDWTRPDLVRPRRTIRCWPELSVKKTDKLRPFLNFQLQVTSSYFKFFVIARRHPIRNHPKLSWKSMTCVNQPSIPIDQNRIAGGFNLLPLAADPYPKFSKSEPSNIPNAKEYTTCWWDCNHIS
jgi:hypothetical protein